MNRYQKIAWFNLIVIAATVIVTSAAIAVDIHIRGYSTVGWWFVGLLALLKFTPRLFKKPQSPGGVVADERDELILKKAVSSAWSAFWWVFVAVTFLSFLVVGPRNSVPTIALPLMAIGAGLFLKVACSVAILMQYGRGGRDE
ncbi:MAG TPA: hypothetical protein VLI39_06950 [Sedimentisphaerales bacterium]|nr:hypothetical protein [Sedimentisphaerales bacterium]